MKQPLTSARFQAASNVRLLALTFLYLSSTSLIGRKCKRCRPAQSPGRGMPWYIFHPSQVPIEISVVCKEVSEVLVYLIVVPFYFAMLRIILTVHLLLASFFQRSRHWHILWDLVSFFALYLPDTSVLPLLFFFFWAPRSTRITTPPPVPPVPIPLATRNSPSC